MSWWLRQYYTAQEALVVPDFTFEISRGNITGYSTVHKFGRNSAVGTTIVPICDGGNYQTPTSAQSIEFVSSSASDALNSTGMHELTIVGLDATGALQTTSTAAHATDGTTAVSVSGTWIRIFRAYVSSSGAYATQTTPSQIGAITIRTASGGSTWLTIPTVATGFGAGQSLCGAYTVPLGYTAYILDSSVHVDANKNADIFFFKRENILDTSSSYSGVMRLQSVQLGITGGYNFNHRTNEAYAALTDIGFMGVVSSGTADISCEFELLLVAD